MMRYRPIRNVRSAEVPGSITKRANHAQHAKGTDTYMTTKYTGKIKEGEMLHSKFFGGWIKVVKIVDNDNWWFFYDGHTLKARTPLSFFENQVNPKLDSL